MVKRAGGWLLAVAVVAATAGCGDVVAPGLGADPTGTPLPSEASAACPAETDATSLATLWDDVLESRGTAEHSERVGALADGQAAAASAFDECVGPGTAELATLGLQIELLLSALTTNGVAEEDQYQVVAESGNAWLGAIGVGDSVSFTLLEPEPSADATPDAPVDVLTACSDRYPDSEFYADFDVVTEDGSTTLVSVFVDARWPAGDVAPIYLLMQDLDSGDTELMSAVAAEHTFEVAPAWADVDGRDYTVWIGEPKYGSASFSQASPRSAEEPVVCEPLT